MNFTVGERRKTRGGEAEVEILKTDAPGPYPIVGLIYYADGTVSPEDWTKDGAFVSPGGNELDLMPLTRDVWVNLYRKSAAIGGGVFSGGALYASEEEALNGAARAENYIGTFKIGGVPE